MAIRLKYHSIHEPIKRPIRLKYHSFPEPIKQPIRLKYAYFLSLISLFPKIHQTRQSTSFLLPITENFSPPSPIPTPLQHETTT